MKKEDARHPPFALFLCCDLVAAVDLSPHGVGGEPLPQIFQPPLVLLPTYRMTSLAYSLWKMSRSKQLSEMARIAWIKVLYHAWMTFSTKSENVVSYL